MLGCVQTQLFILFEDFKLYVLILFMDQMALSKDWFLVFDYQLYSNVWIHHVAIQVQKGVH